MSKTVIIAECKDVGGVKEGLSTSPNEKKDGAISLLGRLLRFDGLGKKHDLPDSPTSLESPTVYYGVYIPCEIKKGPDEEGLHVYKNKSEALELVRKYKLARFKAFRTQKDALAFALRGAEPVDTTDGNDSSVMGEKPYPFKAPSPQDMVALRKAIEAGLTTSVRDRVWDNPRFLVSSGNTPSIMQEGSRYNALHVAAKALNAEICNIVLNTVGDPAFIQRLYGMDADPESCKEFAAILVDLYLNTPDKAMNETPLHFAAKFGAEGVVDVLTSFPQCNRNAVNKFGETPKDVICKRSQSTDSKLSERIAEMLRERYYVPVLHTEDGSAAPTIGKPFTPASPPVINPDPLGPRYEIRAYAGPMEVADAEVFRKRWKTPPRSSVGCKVTQGSFRLREMTKGLESVGRTLAEQMKVAWKEYWPFLDTFTDLRSLEGMSLLENYLRLKYQSACSLVYNESFAQSQQNPELSLSRISLGSSPKTQSPLVEALSPMSELCVAMNSCKITDRPPHWKKTDPIRQRMCRQPTKPVVNGDTNPISNHTVSQLLCIERTCQVFAKRIADSLTFALTAEMDVAGESLKSEANHLQNTINTYMDDERFQKIDFALTHSRLAQLVVYILKQQTKEMDDINSLVEFLIKLRCPNDDIFSSDDEKKVSNRGGRVRIGQVIENHVRCLASFICEELTESNVAKGPAKSEVECKEIWDKASKCGCDWKVTFERNSKRNSSFRKNRSILSTSPKNESFIRRLTFDEDIGDSNTKENLKIEKPVNVNTPSGDGSPTLFTVDMAKCQVVEAEISDDGSIASCNSDDDNFETASENSERMEDASDKALAEPFIYGEEPTKIDRLVFDAICQCEISPVQFPYVYRWRHTVALYSPTERNNWPPAPLAGESDSSLSSWNISTECTRTPKATRARLVASPLAQCCSTPKEARDENNRSLSLQVSNWLRVTGPNSPRSALSTKNVSHNVSFGF